MASNSKGSSDYTFNQSPTKKIAVNAGDNVHSRASAYVNDVQDPSHYKGKRLSSSGVASVSVNGDVNVASPILVTALERLPRATYDASNELNELVNIPPDDPRLTSEGDLIKPIVWRKSVKLKYWDKLIAQLWFRPYLHCVDLVDGNLIIYELPLVAHNLLSRHFADELGGTQRDQEPIALLRPDFLEVCQLGYTPLGLPQRISDECRGPASCVDAAQNYPSIVFEIAVSQSLPSLQQKAIDWLSYSYPPAAPGVVPIRFVQLVIAVKLSRSMNRIVEGYPAIRASVYLWMRYDSLLHANLLPIITANTPNLPAGGPIANQAVCIAHFECGDYEDAQQNFPSGHIHSDVLIPRYALYARSPNYQAAYNVGAAAAPPPVPLFPPGSPYSGDLPINIWDFVNNRVFRSSFHL